MDGVYFGDHLVVGISSAASPVIKHRAARKFQRNVVMPTAGEAWSRLVADKIQRGNALVHALIAADDGKGTLKALALKVRTTADYTEEVLDPDHALPIFDNEILRQIHVPRWPPPLMMAWQVRLPAQTVPKGF